MIGCSHGRHAPEALVEGLPVYQGGAGRHGCAVCAYEVGLARDGDLPDVELEKCPHGASAPVEVLAALPTAQAGAARHRCPVCAYAHGLARSRDLHRDGRCLFPDEEVPEPGAEPLVEGATRETVVSGYERNPVARQRCIAHFGPRCSVCETNFGERYGALGEGFIHVHHLVALAERRHEHEVDPLRDLRPVCPNCHAMLHQRRPPLQIEELKAMLR